MQLWGPSFWLQNPSVLHGSLSRCSVISGPSRVRGRAKLGGVLSFDEAQVASCTADVGSRRENKNICFSRELGMWIASALIIFHFWRISELVRMRTTAANVS